MIKSKRIFTSPKDGHYFCGYYDKIPFDKSNRYLLVHKSSFMNRMPLKEDVISIGYFDLLDAKKEPQFTPLTTSRAWNWQQGTMLQWVGLKNTDEIIFNDRINGKFKSVILNIHTLKRRILKHAIYAMSSDGKTALCIDNERHVWVRPGYSYSGVKNKIKNNKFDPNDGIWALDIHSNTDKKLLSLAELVRFKPVEGMNGATHYVEHIQFSPDASMLQFLHRWTQTNGEIYTRLFVCSSNGKNLRLLNDSGRMTHCCWQDNLTIIGWGAIGNPISKLRKSGYKARQLINFLRPFYKKYIKSNSIHGNNFISKMITGDSYLKINVNDGVTERILVTQLNKDGHPFCFKGNKNLFVTDTYAQPNSVLSLYICDLKEGRVKILDQLNSEREFDGTPMRCDLHPKISCDDRYITVDTMNDGCRSVYLYEICADSKQVSKKQ